MGIVSPRTRWYDDAWRCTVAGPHAATTQLAAKRGVRKECDEARTNRMEPDRDLGHSGMRLGVLAEWRGLRGLCERPAAMTVSFMVSLLLLMVISVYIQIDKLGTDLVRHGVPECTFCPSGRQSSSLQRLETILQSSLRRFELSCRGV